MWIFPLVSAHAQTMGFTEGSNIFLIALTALLGMTALWAVLSFTKLHQRTKRLEKAHAFHEWLMQAGPGTFLIAQKDGSLLLSQKARKLFALETVAITAKDFVQCMEKHGLSEKKGEEFSKKLHTLLETGEAFSFTHRTTGEEKNFLLSKLENFSPAPIQDAILLWLTETVPPKHNGQRENSPASLDKFISGFSPVALWRRDPNHKLIEVNEAYAKLVEAESASAVLRDQTELSENEKGALSSLASKTIQSGISHSKHLTITANGKRCVLHVEIHPHPEGGTSWLAVDVTEQAEMEQAISQHTQSHKETLDKLSVPVAIFGHDKTLLFSNAAFAKLWDLPENWLDTNPTHGDLLERLREARSLPEQADFPKWKSAILKQYMTVTEPQEDMWHLPDNRTLRVVTQPHPSGGLLILFEDVTDRLALERSYNTLIAVQRETLDNMQEAVAVFGSDGRLSLYNTNYARLWKLPEGFLGQHPHIKEIIQKTEGTFRETNKNRDEFSENIITLLLGRDNVAGRWELKDGRVIQYETVPLPDGGTLLTLLDITDSVKVEEALRDKNEALETADRLKSDFVSSVSYELRTPLNSIIGFSEMLKEEYFGTLNDKQKDYMDRVLSASGTLRDLIDVILDLAAIEAGDIEIEPEEFDVKDSIKTVIAMARGASRRNHGNIRFKSAPSIKTIVADKRRFQQSIYTLITEFISYLKDESSINIEVKKMKKADAIRIIISGGHKGKRKRKDKVRRGRLPGLSLAHRFIELQGGHIEESEDSKMPLSVTCIIPTRVEPRMRKSPRDHKHS